MSDLKKATIRDYYKLAKPGIVYGNVITTIAAFLFASHWHVFSFQALVVFLGTVIGISLVIGSACVFNNYLDRGIDKKMSRTEGRALVTRLISVRSALVYGTILGVVGLALVVGIVNLLTAALAFLGFFFYVVVYGIAKRTSTWGTVIGSISGAMPIVVGYTAVTNTIDAAAIILFLILAIWQMPHFYAIAMYRVEEYKKAGIPVLPAVKGAQRTKWHIVFYILAFIAAEVALFAYGYVGYVYLLSVFGFGFAWVWRGVQLFTQKDDVRAAKKVFFYSLIVLLAFCITISVAPLLP